MRVVYVTSAQHRKELQAQLESEREYLKMLDPVVSKRVVEECQRNIERLENELKEWGKC